MLPLVASMTVWPGLSSPGLLRRLDHAERQSVLDRAQRVERLDFHIEVDAVRSEAVDPDDRRVSDCLQNALKSRHANPPVVSSAAPRALDQLDAASQSIAVKCFSKGVARPRLAIEAPEPTRPCRRARFRTWFAAPPANMSGRLQGGFIHAFHPPRCNREPARHGALRARLRRTTSRPFSSRCRGSPFRSSST